MTSFIKAASRSIGGRAALLALVILAVAAATSLANSLNGDGSLIGTPGNDTISAGNGNDIVYGLPGSDTISAGNGNDVIDAEGSCPQSYWGSVTSGLTRGNYCSHGHGKDPAGTTDSVRSGSGNSTIYGGGGQNTITTGNGNDVIYGGPIGDTITAGSGSGQGDDQVYLDYNNPKNVDGVYTGSTVSVAQGDDVIHAQNGVVDTIKCPRGNQTTVYADRSDRTAGCYRVIYSADTVAGAVRHHSIASAQRRSHGTTHRRTRNHRRTR